MHSERNARIVLRMLGLLAIVVGMLSLFGVRPMNSRTIELTLGTASLLAGLALLAVTNRAARRVPPVDPA